MAEKTTLKASCMCGAANHEFTFATSSLPLRSHLCSCNISRRISGSLLTSYISIPPEADNLEPNLSTLKGYKSSSILTRHFCSTCGTQMYLEYHHDGHFEIATGTLQAQSLKGIVKYEGHIWISDTLDGGGSDFIPSLSNKPLARYLTSPDPESLAPPDWGNHAKAITREPSAEDKLYAHCHCKGVEFYISKPSPQSLNASSPFPDLQIPFYKNKSANPHNTPWWLPTQTRFLAGTCACHSCRRSSGFEITCWSFIPTVDITLPDGRPFQRNPYWGTMKAYASSPGVNRTFCGNCGCTVFWDGRENLIDVAVGTLDAGSGARAQEWLAWWTDRVSYREDAVNEELIEGLERGLKGWAVRNKNEAWVAM